MSDERIDKSTMSAAEPEGYDAWFREQAEIGLEEARKPDTVWYTVEEVNARMQQARAERDRQRLEKAS